MLTVYKYNQNLTMSTQNKTIFASQNQPGVGAGLAMFKGQEGSF